MEDEATEHSAFADNNELARKHNMRLQKARRDLEKSLNQLPPSANDHELNELLADMNNDGALDFRCDEEHGLIVGVWSFALNPNAYAHRISLNDPRRIEEFRREPEGPVIETTAEVVETRST